MKHTVVCGEKHNKAVNEMIKEASSKKVYFLNYTFSDSNPDPPEMGI